MKNKKKKYLWFWIIGIVVILSILLLYFSFSTKTVSYFYDKDLGIVKFEIKSLNFLNLLTNNFQQAVTFNPSSTVVNNSVTVTDTHLVTSTEGTITGMFVAYNNPGQTSYSNALTNPITVNYAPGSTVSWTGTFTPRAVGTYTFHTAYIHSSGSTTYDDGDFIVVTAAGSTCKTNGQSCTNNGVQDVCCSGLICQNFGCYVPAGSQTCSQKGGTYCSDTSQTCSAGGFVTSSEGPRCCIGSCQTASTVCTTNNERCSPTNNRKAQLCQNNQWLDEVNFECELGYHCYMDVNDASCEQDTIQTCSNVDRYIPSDQSFVIDTTKTTDNGIVQKSDHITVGSYPTCAETTTTQYKTVCNTGYVITDTSSDTWSLDIKNCVLAQQNPTPCSSNDNCTGAQKCHPTLNVCKDTDCNENATVCVDNIQSCENGFLITSTDVCPNNATNNATHTYYRLSNNTCSSIVLTSKTSIDYDTLAQCQAAGNYSGNNTVEIICWHVKPLPTQAFIGNNTICSSKVFTNLVECPTNWYSSEQNCESSQPQPINWILWGSIIGGVILVIIIVIIVLFKFKKR